ncbi:MAG: hypothetical protein ACLFTI_11285 [Anaerolineales bacterium]
MPSTPRMDTRLLDRVAAERAQEMVDEAIKPNNIKAKQVDNLVTKALGVLQENGVYACFLFLFSRTRKEDQDIGEVVREKLLHLAAEDLPFDWGLPRSMDARTALPHISGAICRELDPLLMTKQVFEQTLIYARYTAKARDKEGD